MKRVLEDELISLAERILKMKNRADIHQLKKEAALLYEKLSILAFAEAHFGGLKSEISKTEFKDAFFEQFSDIDEESGHYKSPDGMDYNPDPISEPNTEKIKDIVSQMPPESEQVDFLMAEFEKLTRNSKSNPDSNSEKKQTPSAGPDKIEPDVSSNKEYPTEDDFKNYGVHFDDLPDFEPKPGDEEPKSTTSESTTPNETPEQKSGPPKPEQIKANLNTAHQEKRSLNDRLNKGIKIGLNDRLAFTKILFDGDANDYNRVLSQLNTMESFDEVKSFINNQIKPDYNNWEGNEAIEERFMAIVERKFDS